MRIASRSRGRVLAVAAAIGACFGLVRLGLEGSEQSEPAPRPPVSVPPVAVADVAPPEGPRIEPDEPPAIASDGGGRVERLSVPATAARSPPPRFVAPEIATLVGVLRDASLGEPIAGAQVELERAESAGVLRRAETAADGSFRLHPLEAGKAYLVRARYSSISGEIRRVDALQVGESRLDLTLDRSSAWILHFRDLDSGEPVAGVVVMVHAGDERGDTGRVDLTGGREDRFTAEPRSRLSIYALDTAKTDRDGRCLLGGAKLQSRRVLLLRAQRFDYAAVEIELSPRDVPLGKELQFSIGKLVTYFGTVVDLLGRPIEGARVTVRGVRQPQLGVPTEPKEVGLLSTGDDAFGIRTPPDPDSLERAELTDELGRFRLDGMKRGSVASFVIGLDEGERFSIPFEDPDAMRYRTPIEIRVPLGASEIVGSIRLNGKPHPARMAWSGATRSGFTDALADGTYRLRTVEPGPVTLQVIVPDRPTLAKATIEVPARGAVRQDFDVAVTPTIRGIVRRGNGEAVVGMRVDLRMQGSEGDAPEPPDSLTAGENMLSGSLFSPLFADVAKRSRFVATALTDRDGRFQFDISEVAAGYTVVAMGRSSALECGIRAVVPGDAENLVVLQILPEFRPGNR